MSSIGNVSKFRIVINTTPGKLTIKNKSLRFSTSNQRAKMNVNVQRPKMSVDWSSYWAQVGRRGLPASASAGKAYSKQAGQEATAKYASEGDQMAAIENKQSAIPTIAVNNMDAKIPEVNSGPMPVEAPEIKWENGGITITWDYPKLEITWDRDFRPDIEYTVATVDISVEEVESQRFGVDEKRVPVNLGKRVNKKV